MAAAKDFDRHKFEELIVYIAARLEPAAALGRVKLAKLLMLCDYSAYATLGAPITGATYQKWEHGHLPTELIMTEKDLLARGAIAQETVDYYGKKLRHTTALRNPDMSDFSEDEIGEIESVLRTYGYESAKYLRALSHREPGWILTKEREPIPYNTVFLAKRGPTERDVRRGEELASLHGWN